MKKNFWLALGSGCLFLLMCTSMVLTWAQTAGMEGRLEVLLCNPLIRKLEAPSVWEAAKATGVRGIEIHVESDLTCPYLFVGDETPYRLDSPENAWKIRTDALSHDLETPVVVAPIRLEPESIKSSGAPQWAMDLISVAPQVGAKLVYFPIVTDNFVETTFPDEVFVEAAVFLLNDLVAQGDRYGVEIAIENLSVYWNRPALTLEVLNEFTPQELGICLDPINLYWYGHPLSKIPSMVRDFLPYTKLFHAKNVRHPQDQREVQRKPGWMYSQHSVSVEEGDIDFEELIRYLVDSQYDGYISVEDDSLDKAPTSEARLEILKKDVEYLRRLVKGYGAGGEG